MSARNYVPAMVKWMVEEGTKNTSSGNWIFTSAEIAEALASFGCDSQAGCVLYIQHKIAKTMEADERKCRNEKHV